MYVENDGAEVLYERLVEEHREILALLDEAIAAPPAAQHDLFVQLGKIIRIHAHVEETVIFPTRAACGVHRAIDARIREIERCTAAGTPCDGLMRALRVSLARHFADEEEVMFPSYARPETILRAC